MKLLHFQGGCQGSAAALRFRTAHALRRPNHLHVSGGQQFKDALIEAKVADGILDFAVFNVPNPITGQLCLDHADMRLTSLADVSLEMLLAKLCDYDRAPA